jgi:DNA-directed RNA polymerase specialized sigma24 family protein
MAAPETIRPFATTPQARAGLYANSDDADLFREAERGNGATFEQVASRYHSAILSLLLSLTGSEQLALDLCHSTLLTAYRELQRRRAQSLYIWFYRLASHQWLAWVATPNPAATCVTEINDRLAALSARERLVFALKTHQHLALETVAQILDLPQETIVRIFTRAVAKLRTASQR